jgi:hypothetical protein
VNNWGQVLVLWMGNYPTELMACSIYRVSERWCPIRRDCAGDREGGGVSHGGDLPWQSQGNRATTVTGWSLRLMTTR